MTPIAPLITGFLREHMPIEQGRSPHTCETYAHAFRLLFIFASKRLGIRPSQLCLEQIDAALVLDFLAHIEQQRGNGAATRNARLAAIKAFMRYVEFRVPSALEQARQIHAIPTKRHDQVLVRHLTMEEVRAILNAPDLTTRLGIRDRAMLHLCFAGGLRVSELVGLPLENVCLERTPSIRVHGKGRRERCLPLWKETATDLRAWLAVRGRRPCPEFFVNAEGTAMTRAGFEYILDKARLRRRRALPRVGGTLRVAASASAQLRRHHAPGYPRHPQGGTVARPRRHPHHRNLPARGSVGEAGGRRGGAATGACAAGDSRHPTRSSPPCSIPALTSPSDGFRRGRRHAEALGHSP